MPRGRRKGQAHLAPAPSAAARLEEAERRARAKKAYEAAKAAGLASGTFFEPRDKIAGKGSFIECVVAVDGRRVAFGNWREVVVWDTIDRYKGVPALTGHDGNVTCLTVLPDAAHLEGYPATFAGRVVSGSEDKSLKLWDVARRRCSVTLTGHTRTITCVAFLPGLAGSLENTTTCGVVSGSLDNTTKCWDLKDGACLRTFSTYSTSLAALPDGSIVSGGAYSLAFWDSSGQCLKQLTGNSRVTCLASLAYGSSFVAGYVESESGESNAEDSDEALQGALKIWDEGRCRLQLREPPSAVFCVTALSDGRVVTGGARGSIKVWDATAGCCLQSINSPEDYEDEEEEVYLREFTTPWICETSSKKIECVAGLADGRFVAASRDGHLRVWVDSAGDAGVMLVFVVFRFEGRKIALEANPKNTIDDVKEKIRDARGFPPHLQKLFFTTEETSGDEEALADGSRTLSDCGIRHQSKIYLEIESASDAAWRRLAASAEDSSTGTDAPPGAAESKHEEPEPPKPPNRSARRAAKREAAAPAPPAASALPTAPPPLTKPAWDAPRPPPPPRTAPRPTRAVASPACDAGISALLASLDLSSHERIFAEGQVDIATLPLLTVEDLTGGMGLPASDARAIVARAAATGTTKVLEETLDEVDRMGSELAAQRAEVAELKKHARRDDVPSRLVCPLSLELMTEPVFAADGHTYEKSEIERWLSMGKKTSPLTGEPLAHTFLTPSLTVKAMISDYNDEVRALGGA